MAGFFSRWFGGKSKPEPEPEPAVAPETLQPQSEEQEFVPETPQTQAPDPTESVKDLAQYFGITDEEMTSRMNQMNISPVDGRVTGKQAEALRTAHRMAALFSAGNDPDTPEGIAGYFGISMDEMRGRMTRLNISPDENNRLTQEQIDRLHDDNIRINLPPEPERPIRKPQRKPEYVSLSEIVQAYDSDYDAARAEYGGKWIAFSGRADLVERDGQNFIATIIPDEGAFHGSVVCRFVNNYEQKLAALPHDKSINFSGFVSSVELSYNDDTITLSNSGILDEIVVSGSAAPKAEHKPEYIFPSQIVRDYRADPQAARTKYSGKWVAFPCRFDTLRHEGVNFVVDVLPEDRNFRGNMVCKFVSTAGAKLSTLGHGQKTEIAGFVKEVIVVPGNTTLIIANSSILDAQAEDYKPRIQPQTIHRVRVSAITTLKDERLVRSEMASTGSRVYTDSGREYVLGSMIGEPGGEGTVYEIENLPGRVAKIYNDKHCTSRTREKIRLMVRDRLNYNGIRFPLEVLNTGRGEFTGFVMERAKGRNLGELFIPQSEFEKEFPGWKKADLVKLCISILKRIRYLHDHDVLMGDINPNNIMFVSPDEVYFIDTDSFQYGAFPCRVGTEDYVAPELQGKDLGTVMRTQGNENFAVATLLFMILMNGKQPYAHQGGTQSAADIRAGIFPYGAGERAVPGNVWELQPVGLWRYIWSHLTFDLKNAFIDTFRQDGRHNTESTRYPVSKWLGLMYAYNTALPEMAAKDPMSAEIFPTREKMSREINYRTCSICHETKPENLFYDESTCKDCHEKVRGEIYDSFICIECGNPFDITNGELEHYHSKGLELPKRCPNCRKLKAARKNQR